MNGDKVRRKGGKAQDVLDREETTWVLITGGVPLALFVVALGVMFFALVGAPAFVVCVIGLLVYLWHVFKP